MSRSDAEILWETARLLNRRAAEVSPAAGGLPPLLFFTDPDRTPRPWETAARLPRGAAVVHRGFGRPEAADYARRLRRATQEAGVRLLIGLDADLAEACGADGVHLPERALGQAAVLRRRRPDWLLTGAVHGMDEREDGDARPGRDLDALVVSPVFPAGGPSAARPDLGIERFALIVGRAPCPVYALGGVTARTVQYLSATGACGLAAVSAIQAAWAD